MKVFLSAMDQDAYVTIRGALQAIEYTAILRPGRRPVPAGVTRDGEGPAQCVLYVADDRTMVVLNRAAMRFELRLDGILAIVPDPQTAVGGWIDVYRDSDSSKLLVEIHGTTIALKRGTLRVRPVAGGRFDVIIGQGSMTLVAEEIRLDAGRENAITISPDGAASVPRRVDGMAATMSADRGSVMQRSLLPEFVRTAEQVVVGDIEPPTRGTRIPAVAVKLVLPAFVPRGNIGAQVIAGTQAGVSGAAPSTAELFLGRANAALAVVGARLERTRIVGSTAAAGSRAPLSVSGELQSRFTLGRR